MPFRRIPHDVVDSTSERAFADLAAGTARHADVHVAHGQTRGRGRHGRSWASAPGEGLYLSVVLLPPRPVPPPALTVAAGLALFDGARSLGLSAARLDWPNDLVVGPAKLAGILVETRGLNPERPHYVVGIGVNVLQRTFPPELLAERAVTSLALSGCDLTPAQLEPLVLARLWERLEQVDAARERLEDDYATAAGLRDGTLAVQTPGGIERGALKSFGLERGLELETARGSVLVLLEHVRGVERAARPG